MTEVNLEEAHCTAEQKKEKEIMKNLKKDEEENFDEF